MASVIQFFPGVASATYKFNLYASDGRIYRNSNGTLNTVSALSLVQWGLCTLTMSEQQTSGPADTGHYTFDLATLHANFASLPGQYTAVVVAGSTWLNTPPDGIAQFYWDGTNIVVLSGDGFARIGSTGSGLTSLASAANLATLTGYVDTEVAAIKAQTDLLPGSPAATGDAMTLTSAYDHYVADIQFTRDQSNTKDEYTVGWFKNGVVQTSGITLPTIQVTKRADGTDLIASTALTAIASTGALKYDATGSERQTKGESVIVTVTATIDAATRTFRRVVGRDSP